MQWNKVEGRPKEVLLGYLIYIKYNYEKNQNSQNPKHQVSRIHSHRDARRHRYSNDTFSRIAPYEPIPYR